MKLIRLNRMRLLVIVTFLLFSISAFCQEYPPVPDAEIALPPVRNDTAIFDAVEMSPEFPGGQVAMLKFIAKITPQPKEAKKVKGEVLVVAVVEKDGTLTNIKILEPLHPACDKQAIRTVKAMPAWKPGSMELKPVRCRVKIPVEFGKN